MNAKLYITDIPVCLTETKLRSILDNYHLQSLTFIQTLDGDVGIVELNSLQDAQNLTATLSRFTLEDGCKLSVVPAESRAGQTIEQLVLRSAPTSDKTTVQHIQTQRLISNSVIGKGAAKAIPPLRQFPPHTIIYLRLTALILDWIRFVLCRAGLRRKAFDS